MGQGMSISASEKDHEATPREIRGQTPFFKKTMKNPLFEIRNLGYPDTLKIGFGKGLKRPRGHQKMARLKTGHQKDHEVKNQARKTTEEELGRIFGDNTKTDQGIAANNQKRTQAAGKILTTGIRQRQNKETAKDHEYAQTDDFPAAFR